jgi:hypothetical protein
MVVEAAEHESMFRQPHFLPRPRPLGNLALCVVHLVAIRQINNLLSIIRLLLDGQDHRIGNNVVDEVCAHRGGKAQIVYLDRYRAMSQNTGARIPRVSVPVDRDINVSVI